MDTVYALPPAQRTHYSPNLTCLPTADPTRHNCRTVSCADGIGTTINSPASGLTATNRRPESALSWEMVNQPTGDDRRGPTVEVPELVTLPQEVACTLPQSSESSRENLPKIQLYDSTQWDVLNTAPTEGILLHQNSPGVPITTGSQFHPYAILPTSVDDITAHLHALHNQCNGNTDELHVCTDYAPSGPPGRASDEPLSLEMSSETQRAMESSDSTPPSAGKSQRFQTSSSSECPRSRPTELNEAQGNTWATTVIDPETASSKGVASSIESTQKIREACSVGDVTAGVECEPDCPTSLPQESDPNSSADDSDEGMSVARFEQMTNAAQSDRNGVYFCHLCEFTGGGRQEFQDHLRSHYDYKCLKCDYTSRTEGRLKRHLKDFHSEVPPDNFSGKAVRSIRPKLQRCKQCDFMTETKDEFWRHLRIHIKEDKRLECSLCCFVTEYKHHLEYHMRNHTGTKPYKCPKCNYECVNKSMLNSHMKSHSNIYPYRCANCHYATKYCHSLKLHLAKHDHKPAVVLNADGSLPSYDNSTELMNLRRGATLPRHTTYRPRSNCSMQERGTTRFPNHFNSIPHHSSMMIRELMNAAGRNHILGQEDWILPVSVPTPISSAASGSINSFPGAAFLPSLFDPVTLFPGIFNTTQVNCNMDSSFGTTDKPTSTAIHNTTENSLYTDHTVYPTHSNGDSTPLYKSPSSSMMAAFLAALHHNSLWTSPPPIAVTTNQSANGSQTELFPSAKLNKFAGKSEAPFAFTTSSPCDRIKLTPGMNSTFPTRSKEPEEAECALDLSSKVFLDELPRRTTILEERPADDQMTVGLLKSEEAVGKGSSLEDAQVCRSDSTDGTPFTYECRFCEIRFKQRALYDIHMGFHSHTDPYLCNRCGHRSRDPVDFFIHLGQMAHYS